MRGKRPAVAAAVLLPITALPRGLADRDAGQPCRKLCTANSLTPLGHPTMRSRPTHHRHCCHISTSSQSCGSLPRRDCPQRPLPKCWYPTFAARYVCCPCQGHTPTATLPTAIAAAIATSPTAAAPPEHTRAHVASPAAHADCARRGGGSPPNCSPGGAFHDRAWGRPRLTAVGSPSRFFKPLLQLLPS